jgi:hypothetical protein
LSSQPEAHDQGRDVVPESPRGLVGTIGAGILAATLVLAAVGQSRANSSTLLSLADSAFGPAPWPELSPATAGETLFALTLVAFALAATILAFFALRRRGAATQYRLLILVAAGVVFIVVGVLHTLLGALVWDDNGFWTERAAFPTAMTTVGGTLIGFAGLAWSLNAEQRARDRRVRDQERSQQLWELDRTLKNVNDTIETCNQLAERGIRLVAEHLIQRIAAGEAGHRSGADDSDPAEAQSPAAWFEELFGCKANESWEWADEWDDPLCPRTTRQLIEVIGHRLQDPHEWRAARQFCSLVDDTARSLSADARLWHEEYSEVRARVSGVNSDVPFDLLPLVDDLEFVRDLIRIGADIDGPGGDDATSQYLVTLSAVFTVLGASREPAPQGGGRANRSSTEDETAFHRTAAPAPAQPLRALIDELVLLGPSGVKKVFPDRRRSSWCGALLQADTERGSEGSPPVERLQHRQARELLERGPNDPGTSVSRDDVAFGTIRSFACAAPESSNSVIEAEEQDALDHVALVLLARVRRHRIAEIIEREEQMTKSRAKSGGAIDLLRFWNTLRDKAEEEITFGLESVRKDFPRVRWPLLSQEQGLARFVERDHQTDIDWVRLRRSAVEIHDHYGTEAVTHRAFDWSTSEPAGRAAPRREELLPDGHE